MSAQPLLIARNLHHRFAAERVLEDVDLEVNAGECVAILGPNGAGKTTLCEILTGLLRPEGGTVEILGLEMPRQKRQIYEKIGVQLQQTHFYRKNTVRETLQLFASLYRRKTLTVGEMIQRLGLEPQRDVRLEHLSGGMLQRVYLGCALIHEPRVLFLDEPTTGLDPLARRSLWQLIKQEQQGGVGVVLTTHYMEEAVQLADRVVIMHQGRILAQGQVASLIAAHSGDGSWLTFQVSATGLAKLRGDLPWLRSSEYEEPSGLARVRLHHPREAIQGLLNISEGLGVAIENLSLVRPGLEDVFLQLTGRRFSDA